MFVCAATVFRGHYPLTLARPSILALFLVFLCATPIHYACARVRASRSRPCNLTDFQLCCMLISSCLVLCLRAFHGQAKRGLCGTPAKPERTRGERTQWMVSLFDREAADVCRPGSQPHPTSTHKTLQQPHTHTYTKKHFLAFFFISIWQTLSQTDCLELLAHNR